MSSNQQKGPQFVRYFQPVIAALVELGGSGRPEEVEESIAENLGLSEEERNEQTPSGQSRLSTRVNWARFYLVKAGLIDSSTRGVWSLTEKGRNTSLTFEQALELFYQIHKPFTVGRKKAKAEKIIVEDEAWIGAHATILAGVHIGRCAIVGAGAVVTEDVPPYTIVAGVPARVIRKLEEDQSNL